jgi:hypothetical protein
MRELLQLFIDIALSRKGPQDVPASPFLLAVTAFLYLLVGFGANWLLQPVDWWLLFIEIGFALGWYATLMRVFGKPERFLQTAVAMLGYKIILEPPLIAVMTLARGFSDDTPWRFPVAIIAIVLIIWLIRAGCYVLKSALELPIVACIALVFAEFFATQFVLYAFSSTPTPTPT